MFKLRDFPFKISKEVQFGNVSCKLGKGRKNKIIQTVFKERSLFHKTNNNKIQNVVKDLDITYNYETR